MVVTLPEAKPEVDDIDYFEETEYDEPVLVSCKKYTHLIHITKTCPCKIQRFFQVVKIKTFQ